MKMIFLVALGTGLGGVARVVIGEVFHAHCELDFPMETLAVNVAGSFAIGFFALLGAAESRLFANPAMRQFLLAGVCGGFTTFSLFSLQTMELINAGKMAMALLYSGLTLILAMVAVSVGYGIGLRLNRPLK